jgi:hypothetical protein
LRSWLSAVVIPVLLGALLIAVTLLRGRAGEADFGPMLVVGTIAYLGGVLALRYEVVRGYDRRLAAVNRTDPWFRAPRQVTLGDDALEYAMPNISARYAYAAFTDVEVSRGLILNWMDDLRAMPVPIRAFASAGEADTFADDLRRRIVAARAGEAGSGA